MLTRLDLAFMTNFDFKKINSNFLTVQITMMYQHQGTIINKK